jgi:PAS domain S-box-containing protein
MAPETNRQVADPYRLLLVEDNPADADLTEERLHGVADFTYDLRHVVSLGGALEALDHETFDVVLLDLNLPDAVGIDTLRRLRAVGSVGAIVVLSGLTDEDLRRQTLREGAEDFLDKDEARFLARSILYAFERHRAHLRDQQLRWLVASNPDAVVVTDLKGVVHYANDAAVELFGRPSGELLGAPFGFPVDSTTWREIDIRRPGDSVVGEIRAARFEWAGKPAILATVRDVTKRREAEVALQRQTGILRSILDSMGDGVAVVDETGRYLLFNPAGEQILQLDRTGVAAEEWTERYDFYLPDGVTPYPRSDLPVARARRGQAVDECEVVVAHDKLSDPIRMNISARSLRNGVHGRGVVIVFRDVTERARLEESLRQSQKMEAVGRLAGGVAHDFNNMLTIITGYSELLLERTPVDDEARELLQEIRDAGERSAVLTRQLLLFSRRQVAVLQVLELNELIDETGRMLRRLIGEDVTLEVRLGATADRVQADAGQLQQLLVNLAVNARDAMPEGGLLSIETADVEAAASASDRLSDLPPGDYVRLTVTDTGCGMSPQVKARVFEPFFTTKEAGKGTGLGLAVVQRVVENMGGRLEVESEVDAGTQFVVYLPLSMAQPRPHGSTEEESLLPGTETLLLVEDESGLRALVCRVLGGCGYTVLEAATGEEALAVAEAHRGPIHLVLTDVVMPGLGGRRLGEMILERRPEARVLYMSGHTEDAVVRSGVLHEEVPFLQKPFRPATLTRKIREVIDAG